MSTELKGYAGRSLQLDLGALTWKTEELDAGILRTYLGGTGYAARLLYDRQKPGVDPLGPEALLFVSTGPLTLNAVPGGGSVELCFKSPLTGAWAESRAGSDFGPDLRKAGFDHLLIRGRASEPTYIVIRNGLAEFRPAAHLSGKLVSEKLSLIRKELGAGKYSIACIGPGGENRVAYAAVLFDDRAAGRTGAGAVFGSKNLLAIAVEGQGELAFAKPEELKKLLREYNTKLRSNPVAIGFHDNGTVGDLAANDEKGDWPTRNWQSNSWGKGSELLDVFVKHNFVKPYPCYRGCTISCGRKVRVSEGEYRTPEHGGAEYESISCFTAYVQNEDMDAAVHCSHLCNEYGIDTISAGGAIAFALECAEAGYLDSFDTGSLDLAWGNPKVLPVLVKMIAQRQGIGALLADGVKAAAAKVGKGSEAFAVHVKGLEGPAHDPRSGKSLGVSYGTGNRGMCHIHPAEAMAWDSGKMDWGLGPYGLPDPNGVDRWAESGKGSAVKAMQDGLNLPDILGTCKFFMYAGIGVDELAAMISCITGWDIGAEELLEISERVVNLQRMFNLREGFTAADDLLPPRVCAVPAFGKYAEETACGISDFPGMLKDYYKARGWDSITGVPTDATLKRLGLNQDR
jgi:aldehyde:ferredoxin oxidoreductase